MIFSGNFNTEFIETSDIKCFQRMKGRLLIFIVICLIISKAIKKERKSKIHIVIVIIVIVCLRTVKANP